MEQMTRTKSTYLALLAVLLSPMAANADPILWAGNGHYYELVETSMTWEEALAAASDAGGYLATVTSQAENDFIASIIGETIVWLGGQDTSTDLSVRSWIWASNPADAWGFSNWRDGEPNNWGDCAEGGRGAICEHEANVTMNHPNWNHGRWNDASSSAMTFYVVEYSVPEPGTLALLGLGLVGIGLARRRKKV